MKKLTRANTNIKSFRWLIVKAWHAHKHIMLVNRFCEVKRIATMVYDKE